MENINGIYGVWSGLGMNAQRIPFKKYAKNINPPFWT